MRFTGSSRPWRLRDRTIPGATGGGYRRHRWTSMRRRWRRGLEWQTRTCRPFSRIWLTSKHPTWDFWVRSEVFLERRAHEEAQETAPLRFFVRRKAGAAYWFFARARKTPSSTGIECVNRVAVLAFASAT